MHPHIVRKLGAEALNLSARFSLFVSRKVNEDHVHARFQQPRLQRQRSVKSNFGFFMIARLAQTLEHAIHITTSQGGISQRKILIEFYGVLKMFYKIGRASCRERV